MTEHLLAVEHISKYFQVRSGLFSRRAYVKAVSNVSFKVEAGQTYGIVGESGCGKSTLGRTVLKLIEPTAGIIRFMGRDVTGLGRRAFVKVRRDMQMIFQDSFASLNPRMRVGTIIEEPLKIHDIPGDRKARVADLLETVGLSADSAIKYPHEFSGGQRQRIDIARALVLHPKILVCDEPVSALDVSIQSQIINLLKELQRGFSLTYIFISHDLSVIRHISDTVAVMYLGKIVESGPKEAFFEKPLHPYSQALISAVPVPDPDMRDEGIILEGDVPSPINPPSGCYFRTRCPLAADICVKQEPLLRKQASDQYVACHLV